MHSENKQHDVLTVVRWPVGGIRTYLRELLRQEVFQGIRFKIVMPRTDESIHLADEVSSERVVCVLTDNDSGALLRQTWVESARQRFCLLHAHGFTSAMTSFLVARSRRTPLLLTAHDVFTDGQYRGVLGSLKRCAVEAVLRRVDVIHAVTQDGASNLTKYLPAVASGPCRLVVIPHGVNIDGFSRSSPRNVRAELKLGQSVFLFGFFGRFMAQKGFRTLVEAAGKLVDDGLADHFRVLCVGGGGFVREDTAYIEQRGLAQQFAFLPFERDIGPSLKGVDAVVMPSLWEASGLLAMEAMVCGTPLIASSCVGLRETIADTPTRGIEPRDAVALAAAMRQEMQSPTKSASAAFVPAAMQRFDARSSFRALHALYQELIGCSS
jgi:glycosyltransferase involved in cell wall biosynthesis